MARHYRGVILDVDGTLVNSNDAHARSWVEALAEHGVQVELRRVRQLIGMGGDKLLPALCDLDAESPLGKAVKQSRSRLFGERYLPRIRPFARTRELVTKLLACHLHPAVASSAEKAELDRLLVVAQVEDLIECATSSSDAERSKPDPDIVHAALVHLDLPASAAVMLGDTPYDIEAAGKLGVRTIALRCGGRSDHDLAGAIAIYDDPADLLECFDESPLGDGFVGEAAAR